MSKILVFDSGLGGLSIVGELQAAGLGASIDYLADTALFPYGEKADAVLLDRLPDLLHQAQKATRADLIIIACNTASTLALAAIRAKVQVPVIGVVPAIKPAAAMTKTGVIGLLATPKTVARPYTDQLIADFGKGATVVRHGAIGLADAAEAFLSGRDFDENILDRAVHGLFEQNKGADIDVVVLACTHYPHLKTALAQRAPAGVIWIDSGAAIAARAKTCLPSIHIGGSHLATGLTTGGADSDVLSTLRKWGFTNTALLPLEPRGVSLQ